MKPFLVRTGFSLKRTEMKLQDKTFKGDFRNKINLEDC